MMFDGMGSLMAAEILRGRAEGEAIRQETHALEAEAAVERLKVDLANSQAAVAGFTAAYDAAVAELERLGSPLVDVIGAGSDGKPMTRIRQILHEAFYKACDDWNKANGRA